MLGGAGSPGGDDLLTVTIVRDDQGYGMKVSGDNPVYVQSVKEHGAAWRAGLRAGDRILRVDSIPVLHHSHQQVVLMIRANPTTVLTVQQNASRHKTPITAPVPVNSEKQRQLEVSKVHTVRLMLEQEQKYIRDLRNELLKVPDVRKQAELESAEQRCAKLQYEIDSIMAGQPSDIGPAPSTPRLNRPKPTMDKSPIQNTGFLSGLPRSLSNLTGQSLRNLRQARQNKMQQENQPPLVRQNSDESNNKRRHVHNNTVPMVPTTCLDNVTPPPLPPRSIERPKRNPLSPSMSPPINPLAKPKPCNSASPAHKQYYKGRYDRPYPMHQSMPAYNDNQRQFRRSSHSLDGELDGPQPNSIAMQMSYPLVNAPPPPLQTDNRTSVPVLHMRSRSSPEQLDHDICRSSIASPAVQLGPPPERDPPPPGTPPPPYHTNTQPCADSQRAIISMEEDDSPASDSSTYSGLFSNLRCVRESNARTAVLLNWLLGERRSPCACLVLVLTDAYRAAPAPLATRRRWAYEIHSTFLMPNAVLQLNGVDENMANEIEHVLVNEHDKEELLCNVFRKARQKAKEELGQQLSEFQVKRQVGLGTLYGPDDAQLERCMLDKAQEVVVVEQLLCARLRAAASGPGGPGGPGGPSGPGSPGAEGPPAALLAALAAAALCLQARPVAVAAAVGASRASFLQRDKLYKQRVKSITKQHQQPFVVRGHHLQLQALTSVGHCHHCDNVIWGLAPQAYVCTDCKLRVHRGCARNVEEGCCLDGEHHNNRISRLIERIHPPLGQDTNEKKPKKPAAGFLNMDRSFRKTDDESWEKCNTAPAQDRRDESDESLYESADGHSDAISASDDALPRLRTPTISKESLKLAITDEEVEKRTKKGHRKTMSLSNPLEIVKNLGDEWFEAAKHHDKFSDKKKSRESLWSEEDRDSIHGSTMKLDQTRKNSKKEDKSLSNSRKSSTTEAPKRKSSKGSSVSALNFLRRKKTPTSVKPVEAVSEDVVDKCGTTDEILNFTKLFLEGEKRHASISASPPPAETDSDDDEPPTPKQLAEHKRRLSRQTSRSKSKARGKSQSLKVNTLRKSHSGTLKKGKKKSIKTPSAGRSRQASIVEQTPMVKKKNLDNMIHNSWLFSSGKGEPRREGSSEEPLAADVDGDTSDVNAKEPDKDTHWRSAASSGRGVNRAESCRERDAPRRGKHRNASDPNRLTAHNNHDLEPGATTAPSGSSSSSSLSSRSNESNTVPAEQHASQSDFSDEDEPPLATQWADSLPPHVLESLELSSRLRKRQDVIHELIVTERSHVRWLKVLDLVFLRGLAAAGGLLAREELAALFPNLPAVRERHARLLLALRAARCDAADHLVRVAPVATALLHTLGEPGYATCLSRFCRGQRTALEALRERRRKNKELHQFLAAREQLPLCGRLQLRDLLPTVWQRLTKYQLLLEGILKTCEISEGEGSEGEEEDAGLVRRALGVARDVLHRVDAAIRNHENECRLRTIQSKLEIRVPNAEPEWEELRRLELPQHALRMEGDLAIRNESNKKINVLALLLEDCLVLLQREGDKFVLKPIAQNLLPLIKWNKVLFRPNAAVRNSFFLMSINKFQMYELSANTAQEYATWSRHIQEAPLAQLTELKASASHHPARSTDDSGINVSRNPSDASEKSSSVGDEPELPHTQLDRSSADTEPGDRDTPGDQHTHGDQHTQGDQETPVEQDTPAEQDIVGDRGDSEKRSIEKEELSEQDDKPKGRRPTVGRVSTHSGPRAALAVGQAAVTEAHTASRAFTPQERLRQLDQVIARALRAKSAVVGELLGVPAHSYAHVADLAVADTLGLVDSSVGQPPCEPDVHQLLLAAHTQVSQLTTSLQRALSVNEAGAVAARTPLGRCRACRRRTMPSRSETTTIDESFEHVEHPPPEEREGRKERAAEGELPSGERDACLELLAELEGVPDGSTEGDAEGPLESNRSAAELAMSLVSPARGVQAALTALLGALPPALARSAALRASLAAHRDHRDARDFHSSQEIMPKGGQHPTIQDQPSNGG